MHPRTSRSSAAILEKYRRRPTTLFLNSYMPNFDADLQFWEDLLSNNVPGWEPARMLPKAVPVLAGFSSYTRPELLEFINTLKRAGLIETDIRLLVSPSGDTVLRLEPPFRGIREFCVLSHAASLGDSNPNHRSVILAYATE